LGLNFELKEAKILKHIRVDESNFELVQKVRHIERTATELQNLL